MVIKASETIASQNFISHYQMKRPVAWAAHFCEDRPLDVEIGSGLGEFLIRSAEQDPERNFVGIEYDWLRVHKSLRKIELVKQERPGLLLENLRFLHVDAWVAFERLFRPSSIHRIFSLFPCPWPKKKHSKHRLFSQEFLRLLNSRLVDNGEIKIVTDHEPFVEWMLEEVKETGFDVRRDSIQPQFDTKFERKWCGQGQQEFFGLELIKEKHIPVPVGEDSELKTYFIEQFDADRFEFTDLIGEPTIILKDFLFDPKRGRGMVHLLVAEKNISQHVWFMISKISSGKWCIAPAGEQAILPTSGVALAIKAVFDSALLTYKV